MVLVLETQVLLPNRPGELEKLCRGLEEAKINIKAVMVRDDIAVSIVRMVLDDPTSGKTVLAGFGFTVAESKLVAVLCPDNPGELRKMASVLASNQFNIKYFYCAFTPVGGQVVVMFAIEGRDPELAVSAFLDKGYTCIDHATLVGR